MLEDLRSDTLMTENTTRQGSAAFAVYMEEMRHVPRLYRGEEARLAAALSSGREARLRLESGDVGESLLRLVDEGRRAEERLAQAHLPLVIAMALRMFQRSRNVGVSLEDLVLAGNEGLLEALRRYDPSRGPRLSTYAMWWIRNKMSEEARLYRWKIRIPDHVHRQLPRIMRRYGWLLQEFGRDPTEEEVAEELGISVERLESFLACWDAQDMVSLDGRVGEDGASMFGDGLADPSEPCYAVAESPVTELANMDSLRDSVGRALAPLSQRERMVIIVRYGLEDDEARTYEEVGKRLGVSRERARQIEAKALRKLRHPTRAKWLMGFPR